MRVLVLIVIVAVLSSCGNEEDGVGQPRNNGSVDNEWSIPVNQVFDGGPGRDGIPALDNPATVPASEGGFLIDPELVLGYYDGENAIAYPHQILDWHEIANDQLNNFSYAITYCPLTGTGIGWNRTVNGTELNFGVSGLLFNNNLIPFDRDTRSNWSQMRLDCVNGSRRGSEIETFQLVETRWSSWKEMYPNTTVVSTNTGVDRPYGTYPYGDYRINENNLLFPLSLDDRRLNRKERVHGLIIENEAKVYRFSSFSSGGVSLINDNFNNEEVVIVGNTARNFIVSFYRRLTESESPRNFTALDEKNVILADNLGNKWDIFGYAVEGPDKGKRLRNTKSFMGYWFAWGTFYPNVEIHDF